MPHVVAVDSHAAETVGQLDEVVGYVLKRAAAALRTRMNAALRPLELTVPQYACLELLRRRPGLSNAELARGAFVTRQSMNGVLRGLVDRGLLTRPTIAPHGRARPARLTAAGNEQLQTAGAVVRAIEEQMVLPLSPARRRQLLDDLVTCVAALNQEIGDQPGEA